MVSPLKHRLSQIKPYRLAQIFILSSVFCLLSSEGLTQPSNYVRVAIIQDAESLSLKVAGFYEIIDSGSGKVLSRGKNLKTTVTSYKGAILIGANNFSTDRVLIKTHDLDAIIINGRRFRGDIQFVKKTDAHLLVVNRIDLEDYIKGVLYHEASHYWPMEALKAQAIISRAYAVYQIQENKSKDYDVTSDIYSQVYGGRTSERERTNKAVDDTKGEILTYQDKVFPTYYHATCAGHTEDASLLWNIDIVPLKGVKCGFCKESPHYNWHLVLERGELRQRLVNAGYKMGMIKEIIILDRSNSGRITDLKIVTTTNELNLSAKDFRNIVSPNEIRSTNFTIKIIDNDAVFEGFGWGHGAGLCQWGAYFMAKQGRTADEILKYYYPQSNVKTIGF